MRRETLAGLNVTLAGGVDRDGEGDGPVVVLLHGYGAPGDDLVGLHRLLRVDSSIRWVFPEGPLGLDFGSSQGRAWWPLDVDAFYRAIQEGKPSAITEGIPAGLKEASEQVERLLEAVEGRLKVSGERMVLGGFSQGAMVACDVAFATGRPIGGLVVLSGALIAHSRWQSGMQGRAALRVFQSHGTGDVVLPYVLGEQLHVEMERAGVRVEWVRFRGGHELPDVVLERLETFLAG